MLRLAGITEESVVDGPGIRMVIYAQGCPHHCEGCHNPSTWSYDGELVSVDSLINLITSNHVLNGITISGGEPFEQDEAFARLAKQVRELGLTVVVYTGYTLEQIKSLAEKIIPDIKTIGVALSAATTPESGKPGFVLKPDEMEYGVSIHSEPGYRREKLKPSKDIAKELYGKISAEFKLTKGDKVLVLVNGMGATPLMEQYVFANDVHNLIKADGVEIVKSMVGNYMTSIDMAGISLTLFKIEDPKWLEFINAPADTIAWKSF